MKLFSTRALQNQAKVTELLTAAGWTKRLYGQAAYGSFYIGKTVGYGIPESIGLWCGWQPQGAVATWPVTEAPEAIAKGVLEAVEAFEYPQLTYLTNSMGKDTGHGDDEVPDEHLSQLPFEDGPGGVLCYLVEIGEQRYFLGNREVAYKAEVWESDDLQTEEYVVAACKEAIEKLRAQSAPGVIVFPLDHEELPDRCVISVAIPLNDDTSVWGYNREKVTERLTAAFGAYADANVVLKLEGVAA